MVGKYLECVQSKQESFEPISEGDLKNIAYRPYNYTHILYSSESGSALKRNTFLEVQTAPTGW